MGLNWSFQWIISKKFNLDKEYSWFVLVICSNTYIWLLVIFSLEIYIYYSNTLS